MKRQGKLKTIAVVFCVLMFITMGFSACKTGETSREEKPYIELSSKTLTLDLWEDAVLTATASEKIEWSVDNKAVLSIEDLGAKCMLKALKEGKTTVTASAGDSVSACRVTVKGSSEIPMLSFDDINFDAENIGNLRLMKGDSFILTPKLTYRGKNVENFSSRFMAEGKDIVSVSEMGEIVALQTGTETITVVAQWNGYNAYSMKKEITVEVVSDAYLIIKECEPIICKYNPFGETVEKTSIKAPEVTLFGSENTEIAIDWIEVPQNGDVKGVAIYDTSNDSFAAGHDLREGRTHFKAVYISPLGEVAESERIEVTVRSVKGNVTAENSNIKLGVGTLRKLRQESIINDISVSTLGKIEVQSPEGNVIQTEINEFVSSDDNLVAVSSEGKLTAKSGAIKTVGTSERCIISAVVFGAFYPIANISVTNYEGFYSIADVADWNALPAGNSSENFILTADIDFNGATVTKKFGRVNYNDGDGLSGIFDGNGHTIKNCKTSAGASQALIGQIASDGVVRNMRFMGVEGNDTVGDYYGCIIGFLLGTAEDIYAEIKIAAGREWDSADATKCVGGLIGQGRSTRWNLRRCIVKISDDTPNDLPNTGALIGGVTNQNAVNRVIDGYVIGSVEIVPINANGSNYAWESLNENEIDASNGKYAKYGSFTELKNKQSHLFVNGGAFDNIVWNILLRSVKSN